MNAFPGTVRQAALNQAPSRRSFLRRTTTGTLVAVGSGLGMELALPALAQAQDLSSPDAALRELTAGNQRYTAGRLTAHEHDLDILKQHTTEKQEPFGAVLSCADSRVPVESIFDQSIGHIFVARTIQAKEVPGQISALYPHIQPAVDQAGPNLEAAVRANAKIQAALLRNASTVVSSLLKENKLKVIAAYYDLASGGVTLLE
jgi:carbonic anhydrase